jgi:YVTN family beta-propeller protein
LTSPNPGRYGYGVAELPQGTVTFLFTDIEGSTSLLKQLRERYADVLTEHQRILREVFDEYGGHEIDTQGDAFFVAFGRAKDAVGAAIAAQRRLAEHPWPDDVQVRVRMGVHTGEPSAAGKQYVGLVVHRGARISAAGHGGQILVSQSTRELLRDDPLPDVSLLDLGEHHLKDLDEPERLFQVLAPGLDRDFAPLKTAASAPFAGREGELAEAAAAAVRGQPRIRRRTLIAATFAAAVAGTVAGVLLTQGGGSAARASIAANSVGVIDSTSGRIVKAVPVGTSPGGMAAGAGAIWAVNSDDNTVSRIDPRSNDVRQTIQVGGNPAGVAAGGGAIWVTNGVNGTVSRIDPAVDRTVQTIRVGNGPVGVAVGIGRVWVANSIDGTVSSIDAGTGRVIETVPAVPGPTGLTVAFGLIWIVSPSSGVLVALDPSSGDVVDRIQVGVDPSAVTATAGAVWVANRDDGTVSKISPGAPAHVSAVVAVGRTPEALAPASDGVWVANSGDATLMRIDAAADRVTKVVQLENPPQGLAAADNLIYAAVRSSGIQHRGGTLRVATAPPDSLDPAVAYATQSWQVLSMTNDGLVAFRRIGGIAGTQLVPDLAVSLPTPTDDGASYTFRLRSGVRYSDGRLVRSGDVRNEFERIFETASSPGRQYFGSIIGASACKPGRRCDLSRGIVVDPGGRTITFHLTQPDADFLTKLATPFAIAVPPGASKHLAATGPYEVSSYRQNTSLVLVRNPRFHEWSADAQPDGYPDRLVFRFVLRGHDPIQEVDAVKAHRIDIAASITTPPLSKAQLAELATRNPSQLHLTPSPQTNWFFLNTRIPPFDDLRTRLAVNDAIDRNAFAATLGRGYTATCQILPPNYPSYRRTCPYGAGGAVALDRARQLVRRAGSFGARVTVWSPASIALQGRLIESLLDKLGFRASLRTVVPDPTISSYFTRIFDPRTRAQIGFFAWGADFPSDVGFLPPAFSCAAYANGNPATNQDPSGFCDRRVDRLLAAAEAAQTTNPALAPTLWQQAERAILALAPVVPTYNPDDVSFTAQRVGNFEYNQQLQVLLDQLWVR